MNVFHAESYASFQHMTAQVLIVVVSINISKSFKRIMRDLKAGHCGDPNSRQISDCIVNRRVTKSPAWLLCRQLPAKCIKSKSARLISEMDVKSSNLRYCYQDRLKLVARADYQVSRSPDSGLHMLFCCQLLYWRRHGTD